jgi:hypothetical protein
MVVYLCTHTRCTASTALTDRRGIHTNISWHTSSYSIIQHHTSYYIHQPSTIKHPSSQPCVCHVTITHQSSLRLHQSVWATGHLVSRVRRIPPDSAPCTLSTSFYTVLPIIVPHPYTTTTHPLYCSLCQHSVLCQSCKSHSAAHRCRLLCVKKTYQTPD